MNGWAIANNEGRLLPWAGVRSTRAQAISVAVMGALPFDSYEKLGTDSERWKLCRNMGYRAVKVKVELAKA